MDKGIQIAYAPERVGLDRVFRIILRVPDGQGPLTVSFPTSVALVDRTPEGRTDVEQTFYFRAHPPMRGALFRFEGRSAGAEWNMDLLDRQGILEQREQGEIRLPRRWPIWEDLDELKESRTIWRKEDLDRMLRWTGEHPGSERVVREEAEHWLQKSDEDLWDLLPKSEIPRWHFVNLKVGCPIHGDVIFKYSGYYPWKSDVEGMPFRVQCPVGGEWYPSNNLTADDFTSGEYPDDGFGCVKGDVKWAFVAVYQNVRGYLNNRVIRTLSDAYVRTGDEALLHKLRVLLLRLADEWAYLSGKIEDRFRFNGDDLFYGRDPRWPMKPTKVSDLARSGHVNYCINLAGDLCAYAAAYDLTWEGIDDDQELIAFAQARGLDLRSGEDVRRYMEDHLFRVGAQTVIDGGAASNLPRPQEGMTAIALCLNYRRARELVEWTWTGGGQMRYWIPNFFYRDGAAYESNGGYNSIHVTGTPPVARNLSRLCDLRPELSDAGIVPIEHDPKSREIYIYPVDVICIDRMYPQIGDGSSSPREGNPPLDKMYSMVQSRDTYEYALETYGDPRFAQVLWGGTGYEPGPESRLTRDEVAAVIEQVGPEIHRKSQIFDGYGIAILRSGNADKRRALWLRYGQARGHRQDDMLDIGLFAHRRNLLSQMGYPHSWATHAVWDGNWLTHYKVKVLGVPSGMAYRGALHTLALSPGFQAARADGEAFWDLGNGERRYRVDQEQVYSRWISLVDVNEQDFYVVDVFRIVGGDEHWWSFHGPHGEVTLSGLSSMEAWPDGTPAGRDVGYGDVEQLGTDDPSVHSLTYLYNCQRGEITKPWEAIWRLSGEEDLEVRLRSLVPTDGEVFIGDGKPPISSREDPPYRITWTLAHRKGKAPLVSQFVSLVEASPSDHPVVHRVERIPVQASERKQEGTFEPVILRVHTAQGTDWMVSTFDGGEVVPEGISLDFSGEYGFARTGSEGLGQIVLTGGGRFVFEGVGIAETKGVLTGQVVGGDVRNREVIVSMEVKPTALRDQYIRLDSPNRSSTYRILSAESCEEGLRLTLDLDIRIGEGTADGFEEGAIHSRAQMPLAGYRYYHGTRIVSASGETFVLDHVESGHWTPHSRIVLDSAVPADRLREAFGEGEPFVIYDLSIGDQATVVFTSSMRRTSDGAWEVHAGPGTRLTFGKGAQGTVEIIQNGERRTVPIQSDASGVGVVALDAIHQ